MRTSQRGSSGARSLTVAVVISVCGGLAAGCTGARSAQPAMGEQARVSVPRAPVTLPLKPLRERLRTVTLKVGSRTGTFLLDTAGGLTIITPELAKKLGCEPWGRTTGFQMFGHRFDAPQCNDVPFELGGLTLRAPMVAVFDYMSLFDKDAEPIDGAIALDVFQGQALTLDVAHDQLTVETPESLAERTRTMHEVQARLAREASGAALSVFAAARTPKGLAWFELDSGNGRTLLMSRHLAPVMGLNPEGGGDPRKVQPQPARFELVGGVPVEGDFFVPDMIIDGNLGMPFLSKWLVTMDLAHSRVWFQPGGAGGLTGG